MPNLKKDGRKSNQTRNCNFGNMVLTKKILNGIGLYYVLLYDADAEK